MLQRYCLKTSRLLQVHRAIKQLSHENLRLNLCGCALLDADVGQT